MKLDDLPPLEIPVIIVAVAVLTLELPGYYVDSEWLLLPGTIVALFAVLFRKWREARAASFALAGGLTLFTAMHAVNRLADVPVSPEWVEVVEVDPPRGRSHGHTVFRRTGQSENLKIPTGYGAELGRPLQLKLHPGALGLRWAEEG